MTTPARSRRILATLATAAVAVPLALTAATPASAASAYQPCPSGAFCLWKGAYRQGAIAYYRRSNIGGGTRVASSFAAQASSTWNRSPYIIRAFNTVNCSGSPLHYTDIAPGAYIGNLASVGMNNAIRSIEIVDSTMLSC